jgi:hypothetical protein
VDASRQEIAYLTAEAEQLRRERDTYRKERNAYREELDALKAKAEETVSAQLKLLSADLSKKVDSDFQGYLKWFGGFVLLGLTVATAGGFFTYSNISNMITTLVEKVVKEKVDEKVKEKEEDIKSLRASMIKNVGEFSVASESALGDIKKTFGEFTAASNKGLSDIAKALSDVEARTSTVREYSDQAVRYYKEIISKPGSNLNTPTVTPLSSGILTISVVVHVVYRTPEENISNEQIESQIVVLNEDYQGKNKDISKVPNPFKPVIGNAGIQFVLATTDPLGNPSTGITRTETSIRSFSTKNNIKSQSSGGHDAWDTERYLNIWVASLVDGVLGYSQFPGGPKATDGIVVMSNAFGTVGSVKEPFNKGRSLTHSIAQYLDVRNIWGDRIDCTGNDFVKDTPRQQGPNYGKPSFPHISCGNGPNGDMFMNFLDSVDDDSMYMFTKGQVERMHRTLQGPRKKLVER